MAQPDEPWAPAARAAGLGIALADFPEDLAAAAATAANAVALLNPPTDPRAEPWPPMRPAPGL